jgi:pyocin large subunit-like protein
MQSPRVRILLGLLLAAFVMFAAGPGFTSSRSLDDHYVKHGSEFGKITKAEYLEMAQSLRDAKVGGDVLEAKRADGVVTRFHKKKGWFLAFNQNGRIRTFFRPNDGERYFRRQAARPAN